MLEANAERLLTCCRKGHIVGEIELEPGDGFIVHCLFVGVPIAIRRSRSIFSSDSREWAFLLLRRRPYSKYHSIVP